MLDADFLRFILMLLMLGLLHYFTLHQEGDYYLRFYHSCFDLEVMEGADLAVDSVVSLRGYFLDHYHHHHHRRLMNPQVSYYSLFDT